MDTDTRKAMVELLLLAPYLDNHLSAIEDEVLERALRAIGWNPSKAGDVCLTTAFSVVREAGSSELKTETFMQERTAVIRSAGEAALAFDWLGRILGSDGMAESENQFLQRAKCLLLD